MPPDGRNLFGEKPDRNRPSHRPPNTSRSPTLPQRQIMMINAAPEQQLMQRPAAAPPESPPLQVPCPPCAAFSNTSRSKRSGRRPPAATENNRSPVLCRCRARCGCRSAPGLFDTPAKTLLAMPAEIDTSFPRPVEQISVPAKHRRNPITRRIDIDAGHLLQQRVGRLPHQFLKPQIKALFKASRSVNFVKPRRNTTQVFDRQRTCENIRARACAS
jgi:hypothetical protein